MRGRVFNQFYEAKNRRRALHRGVKKITEAPAVTEPVRSYNEIWLSAYNFYSSKLDEIIDLPPDSVERALIEAILGILGQNDFRDNSEITNDELRSSIYRVSNKLRDLMSGKDPENDVRVYTDALIQGFDDLHNRVDPGNEVMGGEEDMEMGPEGEMPEEPPEPDAEDEMIDTLGIGSEGEEEMPVPGEEPPPAPAPEDEKRR